MLSSKKLDNKDDTIILRVSSDLKLELKKLATKDSRTLGDYIRLQLIKHIKDKTKG